MSFTTGQFVIIGLMKFAKPIILASESPRRKEIFKKTGLKFKAAVSNFEEYVDLKLTPHELVQKLSLGKAKAVFRNHKDSIIISADTIVACNKKILNKPTNENEAKKMLKFLNNKSHLIITGFTIISSDLKMPITKSQETKVWMRKITELEIDEYIKTKEPFDKAGGYAIQGEAQKFIKKIEGDLFNAIGLPLDSLMKELKKLAIK